jgi:hypothetical protein
MLDGDPANSKPNKEIGTSWLQEYSNAVVHGHHTIGAILDHVWKKSGYDTKKKCKQLLGEDGTDKRFIVHIPIRPHLHALKQLIHLLVRHLLAQLREDIAQLARADEPVPFLVEHLEAADELFGCACGFEPVWAVQDREESLVVDFVC